MAMTSSRRAGALSDINVTPMADIMIVLLIIFMVSVPLISRSDVRLPVAARALDRTGTAVVIVLEQDRSLRFEGGPALDFGTLVSEARARLDSLPAARRELQLKIDADVPYADVLRTATALRLAGIEDLVLLTDRKVAAAGIR